MVIPGALPPGAGPAKERQQGARKCRECTGMRRTNRIGSIDESNISYSKCQLIAVRLLADEKSAGPAHGGFFGGRKLHLASALAHNLLPVRNSAPTIHAPALAIP